MPTNSSSHHTSANHHDQVCILPHPVTPTPTITNRCTPCHKPVITPTPTITNRCTPCHKPVITPMPTITNRCTPCHKLVITPMPTITHRCIIDTTLYSRKNPRRRIPGPPSGAAAAAAAAAEGRVARSDPPTPTHCTLHTTAHSCAIDHRPSPAPDQRTLLLPNAYIHTGPREHHGVCTDEGNGLV